MTYIIPNIFAFVLPKDCSKQQDYCGKTIFIISQGISYELIREDMAQAEQIWKKQEWKEDKKV